MGRDDVQLELVGGGASLDEMKNFETEQCILECVPFTGPVPDQETLEMLNTAEVCES